MKKDTCRLSINMKKGLHKALKKYCAECEESITDIVQIAIQNLLIMENEAMKKLMEK